MPIARKAAAAALALRLLPAALAAPALGGTIASVGPVADVPTQFASAGPVSKAPSAGSARLEVFYGPYCPNSANWVAAQLQPLLAAQLPGLLVTVLPYALDPAQHRMPVPCPGGQPNTPCGVLPAPLCALQPFAEAMPLRATGAFAAAVDFAACDLIHANHGAPRQLTHTTTDIRNCALQAGANWTEIGSCIAGAPRMSSAYLARVFAADSRLLPGHMAPFVFLNGDMLDNAAALLPAVCARLPAGSSHHCPAPVGAGGQLATVGQFEARDLDLAAGAPRTSAFFFARFGIGCLTASLVAAAVAVARGRAARRRERASSCEHAAALTGDCSE